MAARIYPALSGMRDLVSLQFLTARDLAPLLEEETAAWRDELGWDFSKSADAVRRFVDLRALQGAAVLHEGAVAGYIYYVLEESKALIGDLYVRRAMRTLERENALLEWALGAVRENPLVKRVEAQIMMLRFDPGRTLLNAEHISSFERNFMRLDLSQAVFEESIIRHPSYVETWNGYYQDDAARVIAEAYQGHVDALINDQYRTQQGARRFLQNIIQYPGCGAFFRPASYLAFEGASGRLCGISLASLVAPETGHITQLCVTPSVRKMGIGRELLRRSLLSLRTLGCRSASLTCTAANRGAVELYERIGFQTIRRFPAFVWEFRDSNSRFKN